MHDKFPPLTRRIFAGARVPIAPQGGTVIDIHGRPVRRRAGTVELRSVEGPRLELESGELIVSDPGQSPSEASGLARRIPAGVYLTQVLVTGPPLNDRVAFAILWLARRTPARFEPALWADERGLRRADRRMFAAPTDSGTLCFADAKVCRTWGAVLERDPDDPRWNDNLGRFWNIGFIEEIATEGMGSLIVFASGMAMGCTTWCGGLTATESRFVSRWISMWSPAICCAAPSGLGGVWAADPCVHLALVSDLCVRALLSSELALGAQSRPRAAHRGGRRFVGGTECNQASR